MRITYGVTVISGLLCGQVLASGFAIQERSVKGLGRAFSGEAVMADDASVIASNPAGMTYLSGRSYALGLSVIGGHFQASGTGFMGAPLLESDVSPTSLVPSFYYAQKVNERLSYGVGVFANFGLKSVYSENFADFALVQQSELTTLNFNPSVAYQAGDHWSLGGGLSLMFADADLTGRFAPNSGRLKLTGDDIGFGYNLGVIYDNRKGPRVGLSYRSSIALELEGDAMNTIDRTVPFGPATASAKMPGMLELSVMHEVGSQWTLHADVLYTRWNSFQELTAYTPAGVEVLKNSEKWDNSYKLSLGATYVASENWVLRGGIAYDQTPVPDSDHRTLRIPDGDRIWLSFGATYKVSKGYDIDFGCTYVKAVAATINEPGAGNGVFVGEASGHSHVLGIGVSGEF